MQAIADISRKMRTPQWRLRRLLDFFKQATAMRDDVYTTPSDNCKPSNGVHLRAELEGDDSASGLGVTARSPSPVLSLCRKLVEAGHDPSASLEGYRGGTLALRVKSIGQAAKLQVNNHGTGFEPRLERRAASPIAPTAPADPLPPAPSRAPTQGASNDSN